MPRSSHRGRTAVAALLAAGLLAGAPVALDGSVAQAGPVAPTEEHAGDRPPPTLVGELVAAGGGRTVVDTEPTTGAVSFLGFPVGTAWRAPGANDPVPVATAFVARYATLFGARPADLLAGDAAPTSPGGSIVRFTQRHHGLPVAGAELAVQLDRRGGVVTAAGKLVPVRDLDVRPRTGPDRAAAVAREAAAGAWQADPARTRAGRPRLSVFDPALHGPATDSRPVLAWQVPVRAPGTVPHEGVTFVDAGSGRALATVDGVHTARARLVCDNGNESGQPATCAADRAVRAEGGTNPIDVQAERAYTFLGQVHDFFATRFGRDGIDGDGRTMNAVVRYCRSSACPYANAYWDGEDTMVFGDGFVADDVAFHELLHGFIDHTSRLAYVGESGAINEAIADVLGEYLDLLTPDDGTDDTSLAWLVGEDLAVAGGAIRSLADPSRSRVPQPDSLLSSRFQRYATGTACTVVNDYCGVHLNSGVGNKAGYLIAAGGSFAGHDVTGLGVAKAAAVLVQAQHLLGPTSRYRDLAHALRQSCANLVGTTPFGASAVNAGDCAQVESALRATAMDDGPPNRAPRAPDRNLTVREGGSVVVDLRLGTTDEDGDPVRFGSANDGTRGSVRCTDLGVCTYRPRSGFTGADAFTYTVRDGHGGVGTATVRIDVLASAAATVARRPASASARDVLRLTRVGSKSYRAHGPLRSGDVAVVRTGGSIRSITGQGKLTRTLIVTFRLTIRQGRAFGVIRVQETAWGVTDRIRLNGVRISTKGKRVSATLRWDNRAGRQRLAWTVRDVKR